MPDFFGAQEYGKLKLTINSKDGSVNENYNFKFGISSLEDLLLRALIVQTLRGWCLAEGAHIVEAVVSKQSYADNFAEGIQLAPGILRGPRLLTKVDNVTAETTIEGYKDGRVGLLFEFPTPQGRRGNHLMRFVRTSWIQDEQFVPTDVIPLGSSALAALLASFPATPTIPNVIGAWASYVRDNTCLVQRSGNTLVFSGFASGSPDWSIVGIGSRELGSGWPRVRGRQPSYA